MPVGHTYTVLAAKRQRAGLLSNPVGWRLRVRQGPNMTPCLDALFASLLCRDVCSAYYHRV